MSLITLKNVKKEYGKNQVLFENLSLEIEKGEWRNICKRNRCFDKQ